MPGSRSSEPLSLPDAYSVENVHQPLGVLGHVRSQDRAREYRSQMGVMLLLSPLRQFEPCDNGARPKRPTARYDQLVEKVQPHSWCGAPLLGPPHLTERAEVQP